MFLLRRKVNMESTKSHDKGLTPIPTAKIYLAGPWFNPEQKERSAKAREYLNQNPTVRVIHFPFDFQYKDATEDHDPEGVFGSPEWIHATYMNDIVACGTCDAGVFLYDMDEIDDGTAMELGFLRALHKPCIVIPFSNRPKSEVRMNLMIAAGATAFIDQEHFEKLSTYDFSHCPALPDPPFTVF